MNNPARVLVQRWWWRRMDIGAALVDVPTAQKKDNVAV
jgi:hypothetical protein